MTMPWDENLPQLDMSVVGMKELYAYLEGLRQGIASVMGGASSAHTALHNETAAVDARVAQVATTASAALASAAQAVNTANAATAAAQAAADKADAARAAAAAVAARKVQRATARAAIPSITLGGTTTVTLTWSPVPSQAPTAVEVWIEATGSLLGAISGSVVAGSVTATGCKVQVTSTLAVGLGAASVRADGVYWA